MYVIDASVHVSYLVPDDTHHEPSRRLLDFIAAEGWPVLCPEVLLPEVAAAIARGTDDTDLGLRSARTLRRVPNYRFIPVDEELADLAAELAARHRIRACESLYVAVSRRLSVKLITWDEQQRQRAGGAVEALTPSEELEELNRFQDAKGSSSE